MNILVDINPQLVKRYQIPGFKSSQTIEIENFSKSINNNALSIIRIFLDLDVDLKFVTYLGGQNGEDYQKELKKFQGDFIIHSIKDQTKEVIEIFDNSRNLIIDSKTPRLTNEDLNEIYDILSNLQAKSDYTMLLSNDHREMFDIFSNFISICRKSNKKVALSLNNEHINLLKFSPNLIAIDHDFLETYGNKEISFLWERDKVIRNILESGVEKIFYFDGKNRLTLFNKEESYTVLNEINFYNRDQVIAGYISSLRKDYDEEMCLKIAYSCNNLNFKEDSLNVTLDIKKNLKDLKIETNKWKK